MLSTISGLAGLRWGGKIGFYTDRSGSYQLWTINPDGSGARQLTRASSSLLQTIWSSDGSRLAYTTADGQTRSFIMVLDRPWDEQSPVELPALSDGEDSFAVWSWSPDGQWLAGEGHLVGRSPSYRGVYVFSLETEQYERLTRDGRGPRWLSDSRPILFHRAGGGGISAVDRVSGEVREVLPEGRNPTPSPDDRFIYYQLGSPPESDIWLIELPYDPQ